MVYPTYNTHSEVAQSQECIDPNLFTLPVCLKVIL